MTPSVGCAPLSVQFSGPAGATNVSWNLGGAMSSLASPSHLFINPANYIISYTAVINGSPVTYTASLSVKSSPAATFNFTVPSTRCKPVVVPFVGSGGSPGSSYQWAFGDLSPLVTGSVVTHTYVAGGSYTPGMVVVDAVSGCTAVAKPQGISVVNVSEPANLVITGDPGLSACHSSLTTKISGSLSSSGSPLPGPFASWSWTFTGGVPSSGTGENPGTVTYMPGQHPIILSTTDNNNCTTTSTTMVNVVQPSLSVVHTSLTCKGLLLNFAVQSTEQVRYLHTPDGSVYTIGPGLPHPIIALFTPGVNVFTVNAYPPYPCAALTKTFSVFVEEVKVNVITDSLSTCQPSLATTATAIAVSNYTGTSSFTYTWESTGLGYNSYSGGTSTTSVASFSFFHGHSRNPYTIYDKWIPVMKVLVVSNIGCKADQASHSYPLMHRPTAWFYTDVKEGCEPLVVTFRDSSQTSPLFPLTGYTLVPGIGTPPAHTGTNANMFPLTFTYTPAGTYTAYMIVETANGCIDTSFFHPIKAVKTPTVNMTMSHSGSVCAGQQVQFSLSVSPSSTQVQHWHVGTGNGTFYGCVTDPSPAGPVTTPGLHTFTAFAYADGCEAKSASQSLLVSGPIGRVRTTISCLKNQQRTIGIKILLNDATHATVDYGDGTTLATITGSAGALSSHTLTHTYGSTGNYSVVLTSYNSNASCGPHVFTSPVLIRDVNAVIGLGNKALTGRDTFAVACEGSGVQLNADLSTGVMAACGRGYSWMLSMPGYIFPTKDTMAPVFAHDTLKAGIPYKLMLKIKGDNECVGWDTIHFRISSATADFSLTSNPLCFSAGTVQMVNRSHLHQHRNDTIKVTEWNFTGSPPPILFQNIHPTVNPVYNYTRAASPFETYTIALVAANNRGCIDTTRRILQVNNPYPDLKASNYNPCVPKDASAPVVLTGAGGYAVYSFSAGLPGIAPVTTSQSSITTPFYLPGTFVSSLQVTDAAGCKAIQTITVNAIGQATPQIVLKEGTNRFCMPAAPVIASTLHLNQTVFTNTLWSIGKHTTPAPGTGTFNNHIFTTVGVHTITLKTNYNGLCEASTYTTILLADPKAGLKVNRTRLCLGDTLKVNVIDSSFVAGWRWFFGDLVPQSDIYSGSFIAKMYPTFPYQYIIPPSDSAGRTTLALRYFGTDGVCPRTATVDLQIIDINSDFTERDSIFRHCLGRTDQFDAFTRDHWGLQFLYNWDFGDNTTASGANVSHKFLLPGTYQMTLAARDAEMGCRDTAVKTMTVLPLPIAELAANRDIICPDDSVVLIGSGTPGQSGAVTGTLSPPHSFSFSAANNFSVNASAASTTTFELKVKDENGCESEPDTAIVNVMAKPASTVWDTTVIVGQPVILNAHQGSNFTYTWVPNITDLSCDSCSNPVSTSSVNTSYTVLVTDQPLGCFTTGHIYRILVIPNVTLDVPTAFTPNGDGINDVIFPDGWALKRLVYFRVYNRWGQLVYETSDLKKGWDGTFNGEPQNMETYVYQVAAETLLNTVLTKSGSFKLLR